MLIFTAIQPVLSVLLFRYVFTGADPLSPQGNYLDYLMPWIFVQTAGSAVLAGRTIADLARSVFVVVLMAGVGLLVGSPFVPVASMPGWLQAFVNVQPVSVTVNAVRHLTNGSLAGHWQWQSVAWAIGLPAGFAALGIREYRRIGVLRSSVPGLPMTVMRFTCDVGVTSICSPLLQPFTLSTLYQLGHLAALTPLLLRR